jgi:hypothetical protein
MAECTRDLVSPTRELNQLSLVRLKQQFLRPALSWMRKERPFALTTLKADESLDVIVDFLERRGGLRAINAVGKRSHGNPGSARSWQPRRRCGGRVPRGVNDSAGVGVRGETRAAAAEAHPGRNRTSD